MRRKRCCYLCGQCVSWEVIRTEKLSNLVNKLLAKSLHFLFLRDTSAGSQVPAQSEHQKNQIHLTSYCVQISSNMTSFQTKEKTKTQGNSIKLSLEASDKFMEIKVLCKSVVCLALCQITRGCAILHSNQLPQKPQQLCLTSPKTTLHAILRVYCIF